MKSMKVDNSLLMEPKSDIQDIKQEIYIRNDNPGSVIKSDVVLQLVTTSANGNCSYQKEERNFVPFVNQMEPGIENEFNYFSSNILNLGEADEKYLLQEIVPSSENKHSNNFNVKKESDKKCSTISSCSYQTNTSLHLDESRKMNEDSNEIPRKLLESNNLGSEASVSETAPEIER